MSASFELAGVDQVGEALKLADRHRGRAGALPLATATTEVGDVTVAATAPARRPRGALTAAQLAAQLGPRAPGRLGA